MAYKETVAYVPERPEGFPGGGSPLCVVYTDGREHFRCRVANRKLRLAA